MSFQNLVYLKSKCFLEVLLCTGPGAELFGFDFTKFFSIIQITHGGSTAAPKTTAATTGAGIKPYNAGLLLFDISYLPRCGPHHALGACAAFGRGASCA